MAGSMQVGVYGFSSPLVARVVNKYGERIPCMVGTVISSAGLVVASYATDIMDTFAGLVQLSLYYPCLVQATV